MSQQVVSQTISSDGLWQTTVYDDGTTVVAPALGTTAATTLANAQTLLQRAQAALTNNATFINATKPSTAAAQASTAYDQTVRLSRQVNALIRLLAVNDTSTITDS